MTNAAKDAAYAAAYDAHAAAADAAYAAALDAAKDAADAAYAIEATQTGANAMHTRQYNLTPRQLDRLCMLADWQLRRLGYSPERITALCLAASKF